MKRTGIRDNMDRTIVFDYEFKAAREKYSSIT